MWRYISDAATRFATSVWDSLTFGFNLIPAPFVLLSINYKLLTFKNIFASARAGFGSYSDLKMLANAVLVEKKEEEGASVGASFDAPARSRRPIPSRSAAIGREGLEASAHDEEEHQKERVQKIKAEMFEAAAHGVDKTKFAKDDFAALVRAMSILKGTTYFADVDADDELASSSSFLRFFKNYGASCEQVARIYAACEKFAKSLSVSEDRETYKLFRAVLASVERSAPYNPDSSKRVKGLKAVVDVAVASENGLIEHIPAPLLNDILLISAGLEVKRCNVEFARVRSSAGVSVKELQACYDRLAAAKQALAELAEPAEGPDRTDQRHSDLGQGMGYGTDGRFHQQPVAPAFAPPPVAAQFTESHYPQQTGERRHFGSPPSPLAARSAPFPGSVTTGAAADFAPHGGVGVSGGGYDPDIHHVPSFDSVMAGGGGGGGGGGGWWPAATTSQLPIPPGGGVASTVSTGMRDQHHDGRRVLPSSVPAPLDAPSHSSAAAAAASSSYPPFASHDGGDAAGTTTRSTPGFGAGGRGGER